MSKFLFAKMNEDGTYGEPCEIPGAIVTVPDLAQGPDTTNVGIASFKSGEIEIIGTIQLNDQQKFRPEFIQWYMRKSLDKGCITCKKCKEMYRYPGFVSAEECECIDGLECDTYFDRVKNCPNYEFRKYDEPQLRNPDLDKYMYVIK